MRSTAAIAFAIADSEAGVGLPLQSIGSFPAANILAAISNTRFRPSSMPELYHIRFLFAIIIPV
jgi:hypothetical protein